MSEIKEVDEAAAAADGAVSGEPTDGSENATFVDSYLLSPEHCQLDGFYEEDSMEEYESPEVFEMVQEVLQAVQNCLEGKVMELQGVDNLRLRIFKAQDEAAKFRAELDLEKRLMTVIAPERMFHEEKGIAIPEVVGHGIRVAINGHEIAERRKMMEAVRDYGLVRGRLGAWASESLYTKQAAGSPIVVSYRGRGFEKKLLESARREVGAEGPRLEQAKKEMRRAMKISLGLNGKNSEERLLALALGKMALKIKPGTLFDVQELADEGSVSVEIGVPEYFLPGPAWYNTAMHSALSDEYWAYIDELKAEAVAI